jgi:hypothetical protein
MSPVLDIPVLDVPVLIGQVDAALSELQTCNKTENKRLWGIPDFWLGNRPQM